MRQFFTFAGMAAAALLSSGCQSLTRPADPPAPKGEVVVADEPRWRSAASADDLGRLEQVEAAWRQAIAGAREAGFARQIEEEGKLLDPSAALPQPAPTPGSYLCRLIRLGAERPRARAFVSYRPFFCHVGVDSDQLFLTKQTGSERPTGYLWEDGGENRLIFLGIMATGDGDDQIAYGEDPERNVAGLFERVAPFRFRLVVPRLRPDITLDVLELVPAPVQRDE
jgi:hypothetical protein